MDKESNYAVEGHYQANLLHGKAETARERHGGDRGACIVEGGGSADVLKENGHKVVICHGMVRVSESG